MDPDDLENDEECENELDSDDNSTYSDNIVNMESTVDNEFSTEEQHGSFFQQMPDQMKSIKCLSASELKMCWIKYLELQSMQQSIQEKSERNYAVIE